VKGLSLVAFIIFMMSSSVTLAVPSLGDILGDPSLNHYRDTGKSAAWFDPGGESTATLLFEGAGFRENTSFGIYGFHYSDMDGRAILGNTLELFGGTANPISSATLRADPTTGTVTHLGTGQTAHMNYWGTDYDGNIGQFGFYIKNTIDNDGFTWYSHSSLNCEDIGPADQEDACSPYNYLSPPSYTHFEDHALIFDTSDNTHSSLLGSDLVVAFEDLCFRTCGSDFDYDDVVVGLSRVVVTEPPSTLFLLAGLFMMVWRRRQPSVRLVLDQVMHRVFKGAAG